MASSIIGSAVYELTLDRSRYDKALSGVERMTATSTKTMTGHLSGLKSALGGVVQTAAGFALGQGLIAGIGQIKGMVSAASDLNETLNKSSVVFGDAARDVERFGDTAAKSLGQSKEQAIGAAAGFGNLFVSMGMGKRPAADMSMGIVKLASDLASFNNLDPAEVLEGLRSGLVGETEPLRKFGVNVNQANIETKAMQLGLMKVGGELTASAKAQATYALILEQTKTAQGDFANTSTGMANSTRIIKAELTDMASKIGTKLLPVLAPLVSWLAEHLPGAIERVGQVLGPLIQTLKGPLSTAFSFVGDIVGGLASAFGGEGGTGLAGTLEGGLGNVLEWLTSTGLPLLAGKLQTWAGAFLDWVGPMIPPLLTRLGQLAGRILEWVGGTGLPLLAGKLLEWGKAFIDWIEPRIPGILAALGAMATQLWNWLTGTALPGIVSHLLEWGKAFIAWVGPQIPPLLAALADLLGQLVAWIWDVALPAIIAKLGEWGKAFIDWVGPQILPLLGKLGELLVSLGDWVIKEALPTIAGKLVEWGKAFISWVGPKIPELLDELRKLIGKMLGWIGEQADPTNPDSFAHKLLTEWAPAFFVWLLDPNGGVIATLAGKLGGVVVEFAKWLAKQLDPTNGDGIVGKLLHMGIEGGKAIVRGIIDGLKAVWDDIAGWFKEHVISPIFGGGTGGGPLAPGMLAPGAVSAAGFIKPINGTYVQGSYVGTHSRESAMDWAAPRGTAVVAPMSGTVSAVGYNLDGNSGRGLVISHPGGWVTRYGHMSAIVVNPGATVAQGSIIGYSGSPEMDGGAGSGAHLHLALQRNGGYVDAAENYIPMATGGILVGEAGVEAVLPLSPRNPIPVDVVSMAGTNAGSWWDKYADKIWGSQATKGGPGGSEWWRKYAEKTWGTAATAVTTAAGEMQRNIGELARSMDRFFNGVGAQPVGVSAVQTVGMVAMMQAMGLAGGGVSVAPGASSDLDLVRAQNRYLAAHPGTAIGLARTMTQADLEAGGYYQNSTNQRRMALGGIIDEPVVGLGLRTARRYLFGENGTETVTPGAEGVREIRHYGNIFVDVKNPQDSVDAVIRALVDR